MQSLPESPWKGKSCWSVPRTGLQTGDAPVPGSRLAGMEGTGFFLEPGTEPSFYSSWTRSPRRHETPGGGGGGGAAGCFCSCSCSPGASADPLCRAVGWGQGTGPGPPQRQPVIPHPHAPELAVGAMRMPPAPVGRRGSQGARHRLGDGAVLGGAAVPAGGAPAAPEKPSEPACAPGSDSREV